MRPEPCEVQGFGPESNAVQGFGPESNAVQGFGPEPHMVQGCHAPVPHGAGPCTPRGAWRNGEIV